MNRYSVSVIVPVFNSEKHLSRCINSIINQSYKNIEIIIIDDNSTDSSERIINDFVSRNSNIKCIKNSVTMGPAYTRNRGLEYAKSPYVLFLDSDDWIDLNCIKKSIDKFQSNSEIDIAIWEITTAFHNYRASSRYKYQYDNIIDSQTALNLLSHTLENEYFLSPLLGCKLFKKSLLDYHQIRFPNTIYEDDMFTFLTFLNANKIALITDSNLYYFQHSDSITHHFNEKNITDFFSTFIELYKHITNANKEQYYKYLCKSLNSMIICMENSKISLDLQNKYKAKIFSSFYQHINIEEYYSYAFSITI